MAKKTQTKKVYETKVADGRIEIKLIKSVDGKSHTASAPYPMYVQDGGIRRLSKKETEKLLFEHLRPYFPTQ